MNFENGTNKRETEQNNETKHYKNEKINQILDKTDIPHKKTFKKMMIGALAGVAAVTAVETSDVEGHLNTKEGISMEQFSPNIQGAIKEAKKLMPFEKKPDTKSVAAYLNVPLDKVNEGVAYSLSSDSSNEKYAFNYAHDYEVPMSGDDLYLVSKTAVVMAEEISDSSKNGENGGVENELYSGLRTDTRTFTFNGVEVVPSTKEFSFSGTGHTKSEAVLEALEQGVGYEHGISIAGETEFSKKYQESDKKYNYDESFVKLNSSIIDGFIDHYEVENIEEDEDFGYRAKVKIVFGERPVYQLPDGVRLADDSNTQSYYEVIPDNEK